MSIGKYQIAFDHPQFLVLLALRRSARGFSLLLPFVALAIALLFEILLLPESARIGQSLEMVDASAAAVRRDGLEWLDRWAAILEVVKLSFTIILGFFFVSQSAGKRAD